MRRNDADKGENMIFYLKLWVITAFLGIKDIRFVGGTEEKSISFSKGFWPCVFLFFIAGSRALNVGSDNIGYAAYFRRMSFDKIHFFNGGTYWIYDFWVVIIKTFTNNVFAYNFCCAAVIFIALYFFVHEFSMDESFSVLLFFSLGAFFNSMNQTRQSMAIAVLLLGFHFVVRKKVVLAILFCLVASFIHNIAVVMIPVYVFLSLLPYISQKVVSVFSVVSLVIALIYEKLVKLFVYIFPRYSSYLQVTSLFREKRSIYRYGDVLLALLVQIALLYVIVKSDKENKHDDLACIIACMNSINLCMSYLVTNAEIFVRVKGIFVYWMFLAIPHIITKYFGDNKILKTSVAMLSLLYLCRLGVKDGDGVIPYMFFWTK